MYYEEKVINGVLSYRTTPHGKFIEMGPKELTIRVLELKVEIKTACENIENLLRRLS